MLRCKGGRPTTKFDKAFYKKMEPILNFVYKAMTVVHLFCIFTDSTIEIPSYCVKQKKEEEPV